MNRDFANSYVLGAAQRGLREFNERLLLSILRQSGPQAGTKLATLTGLSAQTVSVILRQLEGEGLLLRGAPVRGKVGKPLIPMRLDPEGALSIGVKIGRRSVEMALMDFTGQIRDQRVRYHASPAPDAIFGFVGDTWREFTDGMPKTLKDRICGIGIALPFEIWKWQEHLPASAEDLNRWRDIDLQAEVAAFCDLPLTVINDATAACHAENALGDGGRLGNYAYFFIGSFVGGGVVMNRAVYDGQYNNAGALGASQVNGADGVPRQLLDSASLNVLERAIRDAGGPEQALQGDGTDWAAVAPLLESWCIAAGRDLARAALSACAVIDFEAVVIDGAFPAAVRARLSDVVRDEIARLDSRGLVLPRIVTGSIGPNARVIGAAYQPLLARFFQQANPAPSVDTAAPH